MEVTAVQKRELKRVSENGNPAYLRVKALALLCLAEGKKVIEVASLFHKSKTSIYSWQEKYLSGGIEGLKVASGRGRKSKVNLSEVEDYIRQSPRHFGLSLTRWSLSALAQVVPSLWSFTPFGVQKVLWRAGFRYKRGQPYLYSPDPLYEVKKKSWRRP